MIVQEVITISITTGKRGNPTARSLQCTPSDY